MFNKRKGLTSFKEPVGFSPSLTIEPAKKLLTSRPQLLQITKNLHALIDISPEHYEVLYAKAIENYIDFVQMLPVFKSVTYNYQGGLLDLGIARSYVIVSHYLKDRLPKGGLLKAAEKTPLWVYALFTVGLYYQLGFLMTNQWVTLCDHKGVALNRWNPLSGSMIDQGQQYRYCLDPVNRDLLAARVTPMLAQLLVPSEGLLWLSGDRDVFDYWVAVLQNDERAGGVFAACVMEADELLTAQDLSFLEQLGIPFPDRFLQPAQDAIRFGLSQPDGLPQDNLPTIPSSMIGGPVRDSDVMGGMTTEIGEAFLAWLIRGVKGHSISINRPDSLVNVVSAGVLILYPEIYKQFIQDNPRFQDWQKVQQALLAMGALLPNQNRSQRFTSEKTATHKFALGGVANAASDVSRADLLDPARVFANEMMPEPNGALKNAIMVNHQPPALQPIPTPSPAPKQD